MRIIRHTHILLILAFGIVLTFQACRDGYPEETAFPSAHEYNKDVYVRWNELYMQIERMAKGYRPGPSARTLGYLGLSAYESVVAGIPENNSIAYTLPGLNVPKADPKLEYYWPACVNESYAYLMKRLLFHIENDEPVLFAKIEQLRKELHDQFALDTKPEVLSRSEAFGSKVAAAVYEWEQSDVVGHNAFLDPQPLTYMPPQGLGKWQPTFPDYGRAVYPKWGEVRLFALRDNERLCRPPIPYSELPTSLFFNQAMEAYNYVNLIKNPEPNQQGQAYEGRWVAEFWSDDILRLTFSPPSRLIAITDQVVVNEDCDLATCAELYAKLGMALSDASVSLWYSKYYYNVERPVSYIQRVVSKIYPEAAKWSSLLNNPYSGFKGVTPAFPAYPSGHSGFGGVGGKILSSFFEYNEQHPGTYTFTDYCHQYRSEFNGTPRTFYSFKEMADENAYSRIPLGVHFRMDCSEGLRVGELAAQRVLELPWKK